MTAPRVWLTAAAIAVSAMAAPAIARAAACQFEVPDGWQQASTRWDGACPGGRAGGLGVLKEYKGAQVARLFFGRLDDGRLQVGVVDQDSGYIAGQFDQGRVRSSDERQTLINAFRVAEQAAKAAAERYAGQGNTASARFYQDKARALREQMD